MTKYIVIGEAPDEGATPFEGVAGVLLAQLLECGGLNHEEAVYLESSALDLDEQIVASGLHHALAFGMAAYAALRPSKTKISKAHGHPFFLHSTEDEQGDVFVLPTYHPAYVDKKGGLGGRASDEVVADILKFNKALTAPRTTWGSFTGECIECGDLAGFFTVDGYGYCDEHWDKEDQENHGYRAL